MKLHFYNNRKFQRQFSNWWHFRIIKDRFFPMYHIQIGLFGYFLMIKTKEYEIKRIDENSFEVTIKVNPDLFYFKGHFEEQPILPGVVQLGWVYDFCKDVLNLELSGNIPTIKFTAPILPKDEIVLKVVHNSLKNYVNFEYDILNTMSKASSGRIKL